MSVYSNENGLVDSDGLFENLRGWLRPEALSKKTGFAVQTIYNWKYYSKSKEIPQDLFVKFGGKLFIRTDVFKNWIASKNPDLNWSDL